ncbi:MAG: hypothetical protein ABH826_01240 [Patescibacteria group bacterium]
MKKKIKEKIRVVAALAVAGLMLVFCLRYAWLTWQSEIRPVLATWLLFCLATSLSFATYWSTKKRSVVGNIGNFIDVVSTSSILVSIVLLSADSLLEFNLFEIGCLVAAILILIAWLISKWHVIANFAFQGVMLVGVFPTLYHLWSATKNTESLFAWILATLASFISLIPAIIDRDKIAIVYATRACVIVTAVMALIIRLEIR